LCVITNFANLLSLCTLCRFFSLQAGVTFFGQVYPEDIVYVALPLYHTNGGVLACGQMIFTGATLAIRSKFSASNFWTDCIKYQCTVRQEKAWGFNFGLSRPLLLL